MNTVKNTILNLLQTGVDVVDNIDEGRLSIKDVEIQEKLASAYYEAAMALLNASPILHNELIGNRNAIELRKLIRNQLY